MKLRLIRNATMRLTINETTFLLDPMLAKKDAADGLLPGRRNPTAALPIPAAEVLDGVDSVVVSHLHADHFDPVAIYKIDKQTRILCSPLDAEQITEHGFEVVEPIPSSAVVNGVSIARFDTNHGFGEDAEKMGPVSGYLFSADGEPSIFWTGDSVYDDNLKAIVADHAPDIIVTHSGGARFPDGGVIIMDDEQTVSLCKSTKGTVVAVHMEAIDICRVDRAQLEEVARSQNVANLLVPKDGQTLEF